MSLEIYKRGGVYWAKGRIELNGRPVSHYYRQSTGSSSATGASDWCREEEDRVIERYYLGDKVDERPLTVAEAVTMTEFSPQEAHYVTLLLKRTDIGEEEVNQLTPERIKEACKKTLPHASTDTWRRWIVVPLRKIARAGQSKKRCRELVTVKFTANERIAQDRLRQKASRVRKVPGSREWLDAFQHAAPKRLYVLARFMFETATRVGQACEMGPYHLERLDECIVRIPPAKGHDEVPLKITEELADLLRSITPKAPKGWENKPSNLRVFGYASKDGPTKAWNSACDRAGIERLTRHGAGRHGFATEMFVRRDVDLKACTDYGRWADPGLFLRTYAHSEETDQKILSAVRTK